MLKWAMCPKDSAMPQEIPIVNPLLPENLFFRLSPARGAIFFLSLSLMFLSHPGFLLAGEEEGSKADPFPVKITHGVPFVDLPKLNNGRDVRLQRVQDTENAIDFEFGLTSRPCPPFCIQPISLGPGIETVAELEIVDYLKKIASGDKSILVIDARSENWLEQGMIPGAVSIPWTKMHFQHTDEESLMEILQMELGVRRHGNLLSFEDAKTIIIYCNGNWCGQSPTVIRSLRMLGYPEGKLKWYRGGMQAWRMLGLTSVKPSGELVDSPN